jgi:dTDP-4-amino-4,6-dideoxygalactose transaminase
VDIGDDMNMDLEQVEQVITPRTKAIIPVYLNGRMCDMEKLMEIANEHDLLIIEDAAQALGATFDGKKAGSFGLNGCFSFYPAKMLGAAGDGGIAITNDEEIAEKIHLLRDHGYQRSTGEMLCYGYNSRLDNLQAAILDVKLKHLPQWIKRRRELARLYHQGLSDLPELKLPSPPRSNDRFFDVYQNYVIRAKERDRLVAHLEESCIEILVSWPKPMHRHDALGLKHFHLPKTEQISNEVLSLPMYPELGEVDVGVVVEAINNFYGGRR